jgi:hypothetical protein
MYVGFSPVNYTNPQKKSQKLSFGTKFNGIKNIRNLPGMTDEAFQEIKGFMCVARRDGIPLTINIQPYEPGDSRKMIYGKAKKSWSCASEFVDGAYDPQNPIAAFSELIQKAGNFFGFLQPNEKYEDKYLETLFKMMSKLSGTPVSELRELDELDSYLDPHLAPLEFTRRLIESVRQNPDRPIPSEVQAGATLARLKRELNMEV